MVRFAIEKSSNIKPRKSIIYDGNWSKNQSKKQFWLSKLIEFCKRTDLHGYKYIVMQDFNYVERSCWAIAVLASIAFAAYFVVTAYKWYARNPIVTVIESTQGPIWDIPFPAVTICNLNIVSKKAAKELANNLTLPANISAESVFETLRLVPLYLTFRATDEEREQLYNLQNILETNDISIDELFKRVSPVASCNQLVQSCMWKNSIYRCDELFRQIFTLISLCCTFNYFAVDEQKELGYSGSTSRVNAPRRVASCGYQTALTVLLYTDPDDYYSAAIASKGALVIIDNAYNLPDLNSPVRLVNPSTEVLIALSPERTYTTSGVRTFSPEERQCYYTDEVQIGNFQQYSFHNCMAYQSVHMLLKVCKCLPLFFPLAVQYRICNFKDMSCVENLLIHARGSSNNESEKSTRLLKCLPECEHYDYPLEVALGKLADAVYVSGLPFFDDVSLLNRSLLNVFFNDLVSTRYRRDVYLNWQNILAAFGGLLSLMLGFTLISGVDLLLFFTIRVAYKSCASTYVDENASNKINVQEHHKKDNSLPSVYSRKVKKTYKKDYNGHRRY